MFIKFPNIPNLFPVHQVNEGTNVVLQHNIVAGYERVAYRINGEPCPGNKPRAKPEGLLSALEKNYNVS